MSTETLATDPPLVVRETGTGLPAMVLHGGGGPDTMAPITAHLATTHRVLTPAACRSRSGTRRCPRPPRPSLFELMSTAQRVVLLSAPAGSGKTFLVRSWTAAQDLGDSTAWVSVRRDEHDPQAFWLAVVDSLRRTRTGSERVRELTAAPGLEGATIVQRLIDDLGSLDEPLWLVIDDLHELQADDAIHDLERLLAGAPPKLRFVLLTRRDLRLGLHRLRVEGELTEIRGADLRFTVEDSRALLEAAGVRLSDQALQSLVATTEGWAAGLRLAALSMARDPDPERLAAGFSGRERAVAEYLLAEVLERQPEAVTRLLLRTSILERVSGPLADRLTEAEDSYRILTELEDAGAFVVAVDPERTWFRYHRLFADLLALELQRTAPQEVPGLHTIAAEWLAAHGHPVDAIRHAQAAENWDLAARVLADSWRSLYLAGRVATARQLLARFPAEMIANDAELAVLTAADRRIAGSLDESKRYLALATRLSATLPDERRRWLEGALAVVRIAVARARNDLDAIAEQAQRLLALTTGPGASDAQPGDESLRTTALIDLGIAEMWAGHLQAAARHLEQGLDQARQIAQPWLELQALSHLAQLSLVPPSRQAVGEQRARQAIDLARAHGWEESAPAVAAAYVVLGSVALWRGRLAEADGWLQRAEPVLRRFAQPTTAMTVYATRELLELARGGYEDAITAAGAAKGIQDALATRHIVARRARALELEVLLQMGRSDLAQRAIDELDEEARAADEMQVVSAGLKLAQGDPEGAAAALARVFDGDAPIQEPPWDIHALLVKARVMDALGDAGGTSRALERALDLAEPEGLLLPFLLDPTPELLERHGRFRTSHASLISEILDVRSGRPAASGPQDAEPLRDPLSASELRVLRYLPTNLRAPEIASELFVSLNTIRTHMRNLYAKLGAHSRADAVERARELGLLAPSSPRR